MTQRQSGYHRLVHWGKWSTTPLALVVLGFFLAAIAATVFASGGLATAGIVVAILIAVVVGTGAAIGPSVTGRPGLGLASRGRGDVPRSGWGPAFDPGADDGGGAEYVPQAAAPSDEAWQRERRAYEDKQARGDA